ncbi:PREDICTED: serologically defined colon cancer antigen 8 homolog [Dufourea novaeangliae]|uniref:serologically defined colon cancer antigen 8 homolog n=1 Tax=Dufourea novaeangliae TaxID=178035 RepID=UPI000767CBEC|nr:PREDICTED: serologically defined colon cancer antigen 8 homolog [Dufourea novaeangliae]
MFETSNCGRRCQLNSTPGTTTGNLSAYLARIKFPLRNYFKAKGNFSNYTDPVNSARMKRLSLKSKKANVIQKIDLSKKKPIDYTEMAYREAVSKLKYLLAESYVTKPISGKSQGIEDLQYSNIKIHESEEDTDDKSVVLNKSRGKEIPEKIHRITDPHFASCTTVLPTKAFSNLAPSSAGSQSVPPELNSFIEQQEEYIQQLHQESQFCRNQLNNLLHKVREVVAENEALHYKNKTGFFKCALDDYVHIKENDNDNDKQKLIETETSEFKKPKTLEGPNIVFESRISELEAQLTQAKLELRKAQEENQSNLKRLSQSCLNNDTLEIKNQLEKALHAKYEAEMKIEDLQKTVTLVQEKEIEAFQKMKQTVDGMQQMQFEKSQCEVEIKRLKEELDRQHEKIREATQEASKRIAEERKQAERRYSQQVEQLSADITSHWDAANKSQLESEKQRRELTELRRELSQKQTFIDNLKKELQNKITNLQSELNQALTEKDGAEQEVLATKLTAERNERQGRQEQSRLQIEINSYKQRLERTEAELVHLRRENLRLSEHIISLEKEINTNKSIGSDDFTVQTPSKLENEKELTSMIMDMETKHAATVAGLEDALNNQATIVSHLTAECQSLTQRLEANNLKHKEEMVNLQNNIEYLSNKIQSTFSNQEGIASTGSNNESTVNFPNNISPNSLVQAQNTIPHTVHQEHNMKANNSNQMNNQLLESDLSNERRYDIDYEVESDLKTKMQMYELDQNEDNKQEHVMDNQALESYVTEQEYNSYDQSSIMANEQQEYIDVEQNSNDVTS